MACMGQGVAVRVGGEFIPTTDVETRISTDGPAKINRLTEVKFPLTWDGEDIIGRISGFEPSSQSDFDTATIFWQNPRTNSFVARHHGFVRGVSGSSENNSGVGRLYVDDPSSMVTAIPFSESYDGPSTATVLSDVIEEFNAHTPFNTSLGASDVENIQGADAASLTGELFTDFATLDFAGAVQTAASAVGEEMKSSKTFKSNTHTLKDALDWVAKVGGGDWWFAGGSEDLGLVYDTDDSQTATYTAAGIQGKNKTSNQQLKYGGAYTSGSQTIDIITNDALSELFPVNTITVRGKSPQSILGVDWNPIDTNRYPMATVEHPDLKQRTGGRTIKGTVKETDDKSIQAAERTAKKTLKNKIMESGEGEMSAFITPPIIPGDVVVAVPECGDFIPAGNPVPIEYEVNGVRHHKVSDDTHKDFVGRTYVTVSAKAKKSDMTVVESDMKDV